MEKTVSVNDFIKQRKTALLERVYAKYSDKAKFMKIVEDDGRFILWFYINTPDGRSHGACAESLCPQCGAVLRYPDPASNGVCNFCNNNN